MEDLYFYKGKFYTKNGLKRALIKEGRVWVSRGTFYYCPELQEYEYLLPRDYLRDALFESKLITDEEYTHFQKYLNKKIKSGEIKMFKNCTFYHCEENDGIGGDFEECLDYISDYGYDDDVKTAEQIVEDYCQTLSEEQFRLFVKLPDARQFTLAKKWRLNLWHSTTSQKSN